MTGMIDDLGEHESEKDCDCAEHKRNPDIQAGPAGMAVLKQIKGLKTE